MNVLPIFVGALATHNANTWGERAIAIGVVIAVVAFVAAPVGFILLTRRPPGARPIVRRLAVVIAAAAVAVAVVGTWLSATNDHDEAAGERAEAGPVEVTPPNLVGNLDAYEGEAVTVTGDVTATFHPDGFILDGLVLVVPGGDVVFPHVAVQDRVRVRGVVRAFKRLDPQPRMPVEPGGHVGPYDGKEAIVAISVTPVSRSDQPPGS